MYAPYPSEVSIKKQPIKRQIKSTIPNGINSPKTANTSARTNQNKQVAIRQPAIANAIKNFVVYYQTSCQYSRYFLIEAKKKNVIDKFLFIDVNKIPEHKIPKDITKTPSLLIPTQLGYKMLEGLQALEWIGYNVNKTRMPTVSQRQKMGATDNNDSPSDSSRRGDKRISTSQGPPVDDGNFLPSIGMEDLYGIDDTGGEIVGSNSDERYDYGRGTKQTSDDLFFRPQLKSYNGYSGFATDYTDFLIFKNGQVPSDGDTDTDADSLIKQMKQQENLRKKL